MKDILKRTYEVLSTTPGRWNSLVETLPDELLTRPPAPNEWSALDCLLHLIEAERKVFPVRVQAFLAGQDFPAFDPDREGAAPDPERTARDYARQFDQLRAGSLALLKQITPEDLPRRAWHAELGIVSLEEMLHEWAGHDLMHTVQAERALMQPFIIGCGAWQSYFSDHFVGGGLMDEDTLVQNCSAYLKKLCLEIPERCVGSQGNRQATRFFEEIVRSFGWETETQEFEALDWEDGGAVLESGQESFEAHVSPYSLGCEVEARLASASTLEELEGLELKGKILLLYGEIAREQLMPKNFVFYNPEEHRKTIALLEGKKPLALVCATGRNPALAGGVYPFPLIEDGDFDIPSVYMTEKEGLRLLAQAGKPVFLKSKSRRIPGKGYNVLARKGKKGRGRVAVTAHIDAKKGTPGAIDNATGVIVLLLLAQTLEGYAGDRSIELVAFNGEDYYAVPGQMAYVRANQDRFDEILLNINIDGAGYREGLSAFSFFGLPDEIRAKAEKVLANFSGILEGVQWAQGDHSIFVQYGRPAIAVTSQWFLENIDGQAITHTPKDSPEIVDPQKVVEIAAALDSLLREI